MEPLGMSSERATGRSVETRPKRPRVGIILAVLLVIGGIAGSVVSADWIARTGGAQSHEVFTSSSSDIAARLQLELQHEQDLIVSASGFVAGSPAASDAQFGNWARSVDAFGRYPEVVGIGHAVIVPASDLPAFAAQATLNPVGPLPPNGIFQVVPAGARPFYCLATAQSQRDPQLALPAGTDFCAPGGTGSASLESRDTGKGAYAPITVAGSTLLSILTPVYAGGVVPQTVGERRSAFLGWVGMAAVPRLMISQALQGHPATAVTLRYNAGSSSVVFHAGTVPSAAQSAMIKLDNGWTVVVRGFAPSTSILASRDSLALLTARVLVSLLLGTLLIVVGQGRTRARREIGKQTGELRHQSLHDELTGLPNRALVMDRIEQMLVRSRRSGTAGAALYIDLDEFKNVNDTLGHKAGDELLVAVAARLQHTLRDADTIGRMGGDEFVVLIDGGSAPEVVADHLVTAMRQPFRIEAATRPLIVHASIGIAAGDRPSPGELLRDADVALYQAKAAGKNRYALFDLDTQIELHRRVELEFDLTTALNAEQFCLVYQPIYKLDDLTLIGVEALLRWEHPLRGMVGPDEFIPVLEHTGQIRDVGRWVLNHACEQMADWHAKGDRLTVSVNVSGRQLDDDAIVEDISRALAISGLPADALVIEVTETALVQNVNLTAGRLQAINNLGARIAIDDFGTGYSSLSYLQQHPGDCLKIDRSFVDASTTSRETKALIATFVQLGKDLGLKTLAEGVETTEQMDLLRSQNVDEVQGFLLARPLDPQRLETQILEPLRRPVAGRK